tara:strand:+ start:466 stop:705 length:240 start_codon:yes stop_codon:yes gene_type:complete
MQKSVEVFQYFPRYQHVNLKELFMGVKIKYNFKILGQFIAKPKFCRLEEQLFLPAIEIHVMKFDLQIFQKLCFLLPYPN